jgi:hypothetical protein
MEQFFTKILEYLQSAEFQRLVNTALAIYVIVANIWARVKATREKTQKTKAQAQLSSATTRADDAESENNELREAIKAILDNQNRQTEASKLAFDRSNLKEDVKERISNILNPPVKPIEPVEPIIEPVKEEPKPEEPAVETPNIIRIK